MSFNYLATSAFNYWLRNRKRNNVYSYPKFPYKTAVEGAISAIGSAATYLFLKKNKK